MWGVVPLVLRCSRSILSYWQRVLVLRRRFGRNRTCWFRQVSSKSLRNKSDLKKLYTLGNWERLRKRCVYLEFVPIIVVRSTFQFQGMQCRDVPLGWHLVFADDTRCGFSKCRITGTSGTGCRFRVDVGIGRHVSSSWVLQDSNYRREYMGCSTWILFSRCPCTQYSGVLCPTRSLVF